MLKRIVLPGEDFVTSLKAQLGSVTEDIEQAYHEFMHAIVEAIRFRDKAMTQIVLMVQHLDKTLTAQYVPNRPQLVRLVRDFSMHLLFIAETYKLYNEKSMLMFTYCRHPDASFSDVLLTEILPLAWNGHLYESPYLT